MEISQKVREELPDSIKKIISTSLTEECQVKCEVTIVVHLGERSTTQVTLTITSPKNYDDYSF